MWWLVALGDVRMRQEHFERLRRGALKKHAERTKQGLDSDFKESMPWDVIFRDAALDKEFWDEHVDQPAVLFATKLTQRAEIADAGTGPVTMTGGPATASQPSHPPKAGAPRPPTKSRRGVTGRGTGKATTQAPKDGTGGAPSPRKGKGKGNDAKHADGRYYRDTEGLQLCWAWNHSASGCEEPCKGARSHKCEWCRSSHRSITCSQKPAGWKPPGS